MHTRTGFVDSASLVLVQIPTAHEFSSLLLSLRLPTDVSVRVYRADGFQVRGPATFLFQAPLPARFVGASFSN